MYLYAQPSQAGLTGLLVRFRFDNVPVVFYFWLFHERLLEENILEKTLRFYWSINSLQGT